MGEHCEHSPSAANRWMNCHGSIRMSKGCKNESSELADEGTVAHRLGEQSLLENIMPSHHLGEVWTENGKEYEINQEMVDSVGFYYQTVSSYLGNVSELTVEEKINMDGIIKGMKGTADAVVRQKKILHVFDLKYGENVEVEVENNPQLMIYSAGIINGNWDNYDTVMTHIVQPRIKGERHKMYSYSSVLLKSWVESNLLPAIKLTQDPEAELKNGDWCSWCPALGKCPEIANNAVAVSGGNIPKSIDRFPAINGLTNEDLGKLLPFIKIFGKWAKAVQQESFNRAMEGGVIPHHKLVSKRSRRIWADQAKVEKDYAYLKDELYEPKKILTPAKLEKVIGDKKALKEYWVKPNTGLALAHESDKRKEVKTESNKKDDFMDLSFLG